MYYFLASYNGDTTTISIVTKEKVIDEKETYINVDNYIESLAKAIIGYLIEIVYFIMI